MCGIIGIYKTNGNASVELYEGLLMLQHRGQDSAGIVTTDWDKFKEYKGNGLVKDVFQNQKDLDKLEGETYMGKAALQVIRLSFVMSRHPEERTDLWRGPCCVQE